MEGLTITSAGRATGLTVKKLLAWEEAGYFQPLFKKQGRRTVRWYPMGLVTRIKEIRKLVVDGYRPRRAAELARQGYDVPVADIEGGGANGQQVPKSAGMPDENRSS